jgi:hypothetical protein
MEPPNLACPPEGMVMPTSVEHWQTRIGRRIRLRNLHVLLTAVQCGSMAITLGPANGYVLGWAPGGPAAWAISGGSCCWLAAGGNLHVRLEAP